MITTKIDTTDKKEARDNIKRVNNDITQLIPEQDYLVLKLNPNNEEFFLETDTLADKSDNISGGTGYIIDMNISNEFFPNRIPEYNNCMIIN